MLLANSVAENSRPSVSSSSTMPMGAAVSMKSPAAATGSRPPLPSERPASRYTGIGDRANRRATAPNTASVARRAPSWNSSAPETCTSSALFDDLLNRGDAFFGADDDQDVALAQRLGRAGRGQDVLVAHDR